MAWLHRTVLAGLLVGAYLYAWTPARTAWTEQSAALLTRTAPAETTVRAHPAAHTVHLTTDNRPSPSYTAPAGIKFLLPALFLLLIAPARPRLGLFFAGHLALGALALALFAAGVGGLTAGFTLADFMQTYGVDTYSLAVPVFAFARQRRMRKENGV